MKIGIIGTGQIGQAMIKGWLKAGIKHSDIVVKASQHHTAQEFAAAHQLTLAETITDLNDCALVIVAVAGTALSAILADLQNSYHGIIVSTSGGDLQATAAQLSVDTSFVKAVPNTPVQLGVGITALSFAETETPANKKLVLDLFKKLGQVYEVPEALLGIYGTIAGCTPAFVDVMMEALSDAAVKNGVARAQSYQIITQMLLGTAQLAQELGQHPGQLKDAVTTPGGTTIKGVAKLEATGFRNALIQAVDAANE